MLNLCEALLEGPFAPYEQPTFLEFAKSSLSTSLFLKLGCVFVPQPICMYYVKYGGFEV